MTLELAKRLKEAGFPQEGQGTEVWDKEARELEFYYVPTMDELVEEIVGTGVFPLDIKVFGTVVVEAKKDGTWFSVTGGKGQLKECLTKLYLNLHGKKEN